MPSQELFDRAYSQRAIVVKLLVVLASRLGYKHGWGIDDKVDNPAEWRRVMYVELPEGQYSWHIAPQDQHMFTDVGQYRGKWDGTFRSQDQQFIETIIANKESVLVPGFGKELKELPDDEIFGQVLTHRE